MYLPSALYLCTQDILDSSSSRARRHRCALTLLDLVVSHEAQKRFSMSLRLADRAAVMLAGSRIALAAISGIKDRCISSFLRAVSSHIVSGSFTSATNRAAARITLETAALGVVSGSPPPRQIHEQLSCRL